MKKNNYFFKFQRPSKSSDFRNLMVQFNDQLENVKITLKEVNNLALSQDDVPNLAKTILAKYTGKGVMNITNAGTISSQKRILCSANDLVDLSNYEADLVDCSDEQIAEVQARILQEACNYLNGIVLKYLNSFLEPFANMPVFYLTDVRIGSFSCEKGHIMMQISIEVDLF